MPAMQPSPSPSAKALAMFVGAAAVLLLADTMDEVTFSLIAGAGIVLVAGLWWWNTRKAQARGSRQGEPEGDRGRPRARPALVPDGTQPVRQRAAWTLDGHGIPERRQKTGRSVAGPASRSAGSPRAGTSALSHAVTGGGPGITALEPQGLRQRLLIAAAGEGKTLPTAPDPVPCGEGTGTGEVVPGVNAMAGTGVLCGRSGRKWAGGLSGTALNARPVAFLLRGCRVGSGDFGEP